MWRYVLCLLLGLSIGYVANTQTEPAADMSALETLKTGDGVELNSFTQRGDSTGDYVDIQKFKLITSIRANREDNSAIDTVIPKSGKNRRHWKLQVADRAYIFVEVEP